MSRFSSLEFEGAEEERRDTGGVLRDEAYYLSEARRAFERADFEQGLRLYARALEDNPRSIAAWVGQVRMLIELGEYREAKAWAEKALEQFPTDPELLAGKAVALGRLGELDQALAFSDSAIEERGSTPYIWLARADVLMARGERRADYCFEKATGAAPGDWFITWLAARIRLFYRQFAHGLALLQKAVALDAGRVVVWADLGRCEAAMGLFEAARRSFRQAIEIQPDYQPAQTGLIDIEHPPLGRRLSGLWRRLRGA